jgi:hypothetical protein
MLNITLLPTTRTILARDLRPGDVMLEVSPSGMLISFEVVTRSYYYDEAVYLHRHTHDLFEATNLDGVGPFSNSYSLPCAEDAPVMVVDDDEIAEFIRSY